MEYLNITDIDIKNKKIIGTGTTAHCYKLKDGSVLKLFKNNYNANLLLKKELFNEDIDLFKNITNVTYIENDKIIGYIYSYVNGKTIYKLDLNTPFKALFNNYEQVLNDIKNITDKKLILFDVHGGNILYDGNIHIIDLDKCWFYKEGIQSTIFFNNSNEVFKNIFGSIHKKRGIENITICDKN